MQPLWKTSSHGWRWLAPCSVWIQQSRPPCTTMPHFLLANRPNCNKANQMVMTDGEAVPTVAQTLYVDCTARAVDFVGEATKPVFEPDLITLQAVFAPLVTYSAAIIAYVEANFETDKEKNGLCAPVPLADTPEEWMASSLGNMMNSYNWSQNKAMNQWTNRCRHNSIPAVMNVQELIAGLGMTR